MKQTPLVNWTDPELLFGEGYKPFDLMRDLNGERLEDFTFISNELSSESIMAADDFDDESKEDFKGNLSTRQEDICNLDTICSDDKKGKKYEVSADPVVAIPQKLAGNADKILVENILEGGPHIFVTSIRFSRFMKQRAKRVKLLELMPIFKLPYSQRPKGVKYAMRSKMAKNRKRNELGKFENGILPILETTTKWKRHT